MSRIYGGIHYPIDTEAGLEIGRKVAAKVFWRNACRRTRFGSRPHHSFPLADPPNENRQANPRHSIT